MPTDRILPNLSITPMTNGGQAGYYVGHGLHGTGVFVRSPLHARTILHALQDEADGLLSREERWDVVAALLQDDALEAAKEPR